MPGRPKTKKDWAATFTWGWSLRWSYVNSLLWVFCPRFPVTAQMVYQFAYGILLSVPINFLPPHTISIHHNETKCCHRRVTFDTKSVQTWTHILKLFTFLERTIYMPDNLSGGGVFTITHLWNGDYQFQFVLVVPRHALQKVVYSTLGSTQSRLVRMIGDLQTLPGQQPGSAFYRSI